MISIRRIRRSARLAAQATAIVRAADPCVGFYGMSMASPSVTLAINSIKAHDRNLHRSWRRASTTAAFRRTLARAAKAPLADGDIAF